MRIHEIAKELGRANKDILAKAQELFGASAIKSVSSSITSDQAAELEEFIKQQYTNTNAIKNKSVEQNNKPDEQQEVIISTPVQTEKKTQTDTQQKKKQSTKKSNSTLKKYDVPKQEIALVDKQTEKTQAVAQQESAHKDLHIPIAPKRTGLRIVKKKNQETKPLREELSPALPIQSILMETASDENRFKKKRTDKKKNLTHKKKEQKLDLLNDRDFTHFSGHDDEDEDMILFDVTVRDDVFEEEEQEFERTQKTKKENYRHPPREKDREKDVKREQKTQPSAPLPTQIKDDTITIPEGIRAYEFADKVNCTLSNVIKILFNLGMMVTKNDFLDRDSIEILAEELGIKVVVEDDTEALDYVQQEQEQEQDLSNRPPVVTIMGHVDHGKTSLLDKIRNTKIVSTESGGITQHIGAYTISKDGNLISFIDTPGHEAFTEMRARGTGVTDIVIIVVAADDGIKPQTIEALDHAKAANVPVIIAINKIDKPDANQDKVKSEAAELGYTPIEWGGTHEFIPISAKTGEGIDTLLETILIQAEILELKANPKASAKAVVIESSLEKGKGPVATVIVKNGTLKVGESIVADTAYGRVRALIDDTGKSIKSIGPSEVAVVTGLGEVPVAGAVLMAVASDAMAREYAEKRASYLRQKEFSRSTKVSLDELSSMVAEGQLKSLPIIIKTDTQGSLEAIKGSLEKIRNNEVKVHIIHSGVGGITESDVVLAQTSKHTVILGFNVRPTGIVKSRAKEIGVEIKTYSVIYDLVNEIKSVLSGMMSPVFEEESTGQAEVREVFKVPKIGVVAGCFVSDGIIQKGVRARIIRDGVVVHGSIITSLKRFKDDVKEVPKGFECGIMLENINDIIVNDVIETYKETKKTKTL